MPQSAIDNLTERFSSSQQLPEFNSKSFVSRGFKKCVRVSVVFSKLTIRLLNLFAWIGGLIALVYTFLPQLSVDHSEPLDPNDPFSAHFVISNDGYTTIYCANFSCLINTLDSANGSRIEHNTGEIRNYSLMKLDGKHKITVPCVSGVKLPSIQRADIDLEITYTSYFHFLHFWPFRTTQRFNFSTAVRSDGLLTWEQGSYIAAIEQTRNDEKRNQNGGVNSKAKCPFSLFRPCACPTGK